MADQETKSNNREPRWKRLRLSLLLSIGGFVVFLLGIRPDIFQMDRSPVIGIIQIVVSVIGLALLSLGGFLNMRNLWNGKSLSIAAEIGIRFIGTGLVIAIFSSLADFFGFGSHPYPDSLPFLGEWQILGIRIGEYTIGLGLFLMIPFPKVQILPKTLRSDNSNR